ncbi:MAG: hypothetical protein U5J63_07610 [Fodinibius sp.]|nr:hypothetical protein [Fodinibius sp.]
MSLKRRPTDDIEEASEAALARPEPDPNADQHDMLLLKQNDDGSPDIQLIGGLGPI